MSYFWIGRKYQLCKTLYFDDYMVACGVGPVLRKMGNSLFPIVQITYNDETGFYTLSTTTDYFSNEITFRFDEEFDEETLDGRKCRSIISLNENTLVHVQTHKRVTSTIIREFCESGMLAAFMACDKKSIRMYKNYIEPEEENTESEEPEKRKSNSSNNEIIDNSQPE